MIHAPNNIPYMYLLCQAHYSFILARERTLLCGYKLYWSDISIIKADGYWGGHRSGTAMGPNDEMYFSGVYLRGNVECYGCGGLIYAHLSAE